MSATTSAIASATVSGFSNYDNYGKRQATNFFIIACTILGVFGICTGCCCISLRYRKRRMQRIVTAAFEQGMFQHAEVGERLDTLRRGVRIPQVKKEVMERPQLYEVRQNEHAEWHATPHRATHISRPPVDWSEYRPLSACVSDPTALDPQLSNLPIDTQLAYLFHAKVQLKREWKRSSRPRASVPPYVLKHGQESLKPPPGPPSLRFSVLIAMPATTPASAGLVLGVASACYNSIPIEDGKTNDKMKDTADSNA